MMSDGAGDSVEKGWELLEEGDPAAAAAVAAEILAASPDDVEALLLAGAALLEAGAPGESETMLRRASRLAPDEPRVILSLGHLHFEVCRFDEALRAARSLLRQQELAEARWLEGLALDLLGRKDEADSSFEKAARLDPSRFGAVPEISEARFREAIRDALASLPEMFQEAIRDLPIVLRDVPTPEMLSSMDDPSPELLGLFVGIPLTEKSWSDPSGVASITLFTRNLERACSDGAELVREIRVTLLHEIGHYLGMTEEELDAAGYS